jgi:putative FmdB family regulatory protein
MPIYEFTCGPCNTVFSFLSRRPGVPCAPDCPACGGALSREVSPFACPGDGKRGTDGADGDDPLASVDEARMARAMEVLSAEMGAADEAEADPRESARCFNEFAKRSGMTFNPAVREALARLAAGADPDRVEAEMGDALNVENPFASETGGPLHDSLRRMRREPRRDPKLYDLS